MTLASLAIGANRATPAELVRDLDAELRNWTREHPVIQTPEEARAAAQLAQRAKNTLADLDDERKAKVGPLNEKVKGINAEYAQAVIPIHTGLDVLKWRMTAYTIAEEEKRREAANEAARIAIETQNRAIEALQAAQEAKNNALVGETADVVSLSQEAVRAQNDYRRAERDFKRAEREANSSVKVATGFGRAMSARTKEILTVTDAAAAIGAIGLTEGIAEAILTAARSYKKLKGNYPPGIAVNTTRSI